MEWRKTVDATYVSNYIFLNIFYVDFIVGFYWFLNYIFFVLYDHQEINC